MSDEAVCVGQSKKRQYDQEVENLERQQKQTIERLEQEHTNRLRDEAKRIKAEQDKELSKCQNMLKNRKKEVSPSSPPLSPPSVTNSALICPPEFLQRLSHQGRLNLTLSTALPHYSSLSCSRLPRSKQEAGLSPQHVTMKCLKEGFLFQPSLTLENVYYIKSQSHHCSDV